MVSIVLTRNQCEENRTAVVIVTCSIQGNHAHFKHSPYAGTVQVR